jgi:hypothetical protein
MSSVDFDEKKGGLKRAVINNLRSAIAEWREYSLRRR